MPTKGFSRGLLNGVASGGTKLFQAILGADKAYQQGVDREQLNQSRIAQAAGATAKNSAAAAQGKAKAEALLGRDGNIDEAIAASTGATIPDVNAFREYLQSGFIPERQLPGPPTEDGMTAGTAPAFDPSSEASSRIGREIARYALLRSNVNDFNPAQLADADATYGTTDLRNQILGGQRTPQAVNDAVAASTGKLQQGGGTAKAPTGFQWSPDQPGSLQHSTCQCSSGM